MVQVTAPDRNPPVPCRGARRRRRPSVAALLAVAAIATFALLRPGPFRAAVTEPAALLRIGVVVAALVAWSTLVGRFVRLVALRSALVAVPVVLVGWVAIVPYFQTSRVDEALPGLADVAAGEPAGALSTPGSAPAPAVAPPAPSTTVAAPTEPVLVGSAPLAGIDHRATGTAALYRLPEGSLVIRLEEVDIESGPDYDLYVVAGHDRAQHDGGARLDDLRAVQGSHNYPVAADAGVDVTVPFTVLVWCERFAVPVANATITPVVA